MRSLDLIVCYFIMLIGVVGYSFSPAGWLQVVFLFAVVGAAVAGIIIELRG